MQQQDAAEDILIAGAGLAGLAVALGLHRKGVRSVVLESSPVLRTSGFAFMTWTNAFRALDALGVGDKMRSQHLQGACHVFDNRGSSARDGSPGARKIGTPRSPVRAAERAAPGAGGGAASRNHPLLLQDRLHRRGWGCQDPPSRRRVDAQREGSYRVRRDQLRGGEMVGAGQAVRLRAHGHAGPRQVPRRPWVRAQVHAVHRQRLPCRPRPLRPHRCLLVPHRSPSPNDKGGIEHEQSAAAMKQFVLGKLRSINAPPEVLEAVERSEMNDVLVAPLRYRPPLSLLFASISKGNVCVVGHALHPTTPDLALEDGVVLARCLGDAMAGGSESVEEALRRYAGLRRWRSAQVIASSYMVGFMQQSENAALSFVRDRLLSGVLAKVRLMMPDYDCGTL